MVRSFPPNTRKPKQQARPPCCEYAETHFHDHNGEPSAVNGYGLMHLVDNPQTQTLEAAARLTGVTVEVLKMDMTENIRGGAALLRAYADGQGMDENSRQNLAAWYEVVARYSNASDMAVARLYADAVYNLLNSGFSGASPQGEEIIVTAVEVEPRRGNYEQVIQLTSPDYAPMALDYGPALWVPANSGNYTVSDRESSYPINYVVIHTTQGSYSGTISWFQNPDNETSGRFTASGAWDISSWNSQRHGSDYRFTTPQAISDAAWFKANIPTTGNYEVFAWYPANSGYNSSTPFVIVTTSGNQVVHVNQQINGGSWVSLGTFNLSVGDYNVVGVSRWTSTPGYVIADAVKIVRR